MSVSRENKRLLFICTHNTARSQMVERLLSAFHGDIYEAFRAGTEPGWVSPYVIKVIEEIGSEICPRRSKNIRNSWIRNLTMWSPCAIMRMNPADIFLVVKKSFTRALKILRSPVTLAMMFDVFYF